MKPTILTNKIIAVASVLTLLIAPIATVTADQANVAIRDNYYSPQTLVVTPGTMVVWTNLGNMAHTVTSENNLFNSGSLNPGNSYSYTFNTPGTYYYHCSFHSGMNGVIVVQSGNIPPQTTNTSLNASVVQSNPANPIIINQITAVRTAGVADNTFENGWKWVFDITTPANEPNLMMKFENWFSQNSTLSASSNMRFYSQQSSNAFSQNNAIYITAPNTYSNSMFLTGDLDSSTQTRRVQITVETRIPVGTPIGSYTTNFGIQTQ